MWLDTRPAFGAPRSGLSGSPSDPRCSEGVLRHGAVLGRDRVPAVQVGTAAVLKDIGMAVNGGGTL